jgi:class 3 adenylate cyclase
MAAAFAALPLATGLAILRHRLYAIDFILNKALVFTGVSVILGIVFLALTGLSEALLDRWVGQRPSQLPAANGLAVGLVFPAVRRRTQALVDRALPSREELGLLFMDIVGSTGRLAAMGDVPWRDLLIQFRGAVRREVKRCKGVEVDTSGDGFFVTFRRPADTVACARAVVPAVNALGLSVRVGLHWGPCETRGETPSGLNVHLGARLMALAGADEILASAALREVLPREAAAGFADHGEHALKGVPGRWSAYRVPVVPAHSSLAVPAESLVLRGADAAAGI